MKPKTNNTALRQKKANLIRKNSVPCLTTKTLTGKVSPAGLLFKDNKENLNVATKMKMHGVIQDMKNRMIRWLINSFQCSNIWRTSDHF